MARNTATEVRVILPAETTLTDAQIDQAIIAAMCVVDDIAAGCGEGLSDVCLKQVELYLSAHFAAATENTLTKSSEKDGCSDTSVTYGFKFGTGVMGTPFGQTANTISGGCVAEFDKAPVNIFAIGVQGNDSLLIQS